MTTTTQHTFTKRIVRIKCGPTARSMIAAAIRADAAMYGQAVLTCPAVARGDSWQTAAQYTSAIR